MRAGTQTALLLKSLLKDKLGNIVSLWELLLNPKDGGTGYSGVAASSLQQKLCNGHSG